MLGVEGQEEIQNDHHSETREEISNQEKEVDTVKMESGSLELEILSFQIIKVKRVEKAEESSSNLLTPLTRSCRLCISTKAVFHMDSAK